MGRKWSSSSKTFLVLAVVFGLGAFALVHAYAARVQRLDAALGHPVPVAVATLSLGRGAILDDSMLRVEEYPKTYAPPGAVTDPETVAGRVLLAPVARGEPVTLGRLAPKAGPVAALVPPGLRAVTITSAMTAGSIRAGDRVDVLATFPGVHAHTETVATGLEVLRAGPAGGQTGEGVFSPDAATGSAGAVLVLLVDPAQAEELAFARAFADLSVAVDGAEEVVASEGP